MTRRNPSLELEHAGAPLGQNPTGEFESTKKRAVAAPPIHDLTIRPAKFGDARQLFEWRNDQLTREMSKTANPVLWDEHVEWLTRQLVREEPGLFIAESDGAPVGTIRIDGDEVSYTVAPEHRGNCLLYTSPSPRDRS